METLTETKQFGGTQGVYRHASEACGCDMTFAVYLPPQAAVGSESGRVPVLWYLSGLTCTHANVVDKGQYQQAAARYGVAVVCPDTSPRGEGVADADAGPDAWQRGQGASFYVDATEKPWAEHFQMATYVGDELPALVAANFPVDMDRQGIAGHSMGGHGALTQALRNEDRFLSVSAFAPIVAPTRAEWARGAFADYLGDKEKAWARWDACELVRGGARVPSVLIDQGAADPFLTDGLMPHLFAEACAEAGIECALRMHPGYDHSYGFVSTFMDDHLAWHAARLFTG